MAAADDESGTDKAQSAALQAVAARRLSRWQETLLPFMMVGLVVLGVIFFVATLRNYEGMQARLGRPADDIRLTLDRLQASNTTDAQRDWYLRVVLEDRALRSRHEQNSAVVEARVWTRFMGFMTGMVLVMAGCIFILGKLEASFDGSMKTAQAEGTLRTNSPGLVLAVVGSVLIAISLTVTVQVEVNDKPVYLPQLVQDQGPSPPVMKPPEPLPSTAPAPVAASAAAPAASSPYPADVQEQMCKAAGKPPGCMSPSR